VSVIDSDGLPCRTIPVVSNPIASMIRQKVALESLVLLQRLPCPRQLLSPVVRLSILNLVLKRPPVQKLAFLARQQKVDLFAAYSQPVKPFALTFSHWFGSNINTSIDRRLLDCSPGLRFCGPTCAALSAIFGHKECSCVDIQPVSIKQGLFSIKARSQAAIHALASVHAS
jgi:hypothetical protein